MKTNFDISFSKPLALYVKADNELLLSNCSKNSTSPFLLHYFSNFRAHCGTLQV